MDSHKPKLTRTPSSLLRSPTLRSSTHSLSSLDHHHHIPSSPKKAHKPAHPLPHPAPFALLSLLLLLLLLFFTLSLPHFLLVSLSLALLCLLKRITPRSRSISAQSSIQWFIGDDDGHQFSRSGSCPKSKIVKEGVELYSNGDLYEGEFHKGSCNGSGVYSFFGKGRYEGDWVDGKYDGYGIESWAKGSRYRGQYSNGLRHGFGVYRFFNGDTYAGEWVGGQSHGRGLQICADGSCYVGEFKAGVKHGLGFYHFR